MRGRKPTPTHLKLISGSHNVRKDANEPQPIGDLRDPPEDLSDREKLIWRSAIDNAPRGLLRILDGHLLRLWVEAWDTRLEARAKVKEFGAVVKSPKQGVPMKSPFQCIVDQQTEIIKGLTSELGFSPTSRSRITLGAGAKDANPFSKHAAKRA